MARDLSVRWCLAVDGTSAHYRIPTACDSVPSINCTGHVGDAMTSSAALGWESFDHRYVVTFQTSTWNVAGSACLIVLHALVTKLTSQTF